MSTLITKLFRKKRIILPSVHLSQIVLSAVTSVFLIQYNTIQHRLFPTENTITPQQQFLPNIGMGGKGVDRRIILSWSTPIWLKSCRKMHPLPIHVSAKFHLDIFHFKKDMVIGIFHIRSNNCLANERFFD